MNVVTLIVLVISQIIFLVVFVVIFTKVLTPTLKEVQEIVDNVKTFTEGTVRDTQKYIGEKITQTNVLINDLKKAAQKC